jgi:hypothetical protein
MLPLFADLPARATTELLDSIERESKGQLANLVALWEEYERRAERAA